MRKNRPARPPIPSTPTCRVENTSREVIERRLLTSLERGNHVAIVVGKADLSAIISAMDHYAMMLPTDSEEQRRSRTFHSDVAALYRGAF